MVNDKQTLEFQKMQVFLDDMKEITFDYDNPQSISNQILALTEEYRLWQILVNTPRGWAKEKTKEVLLRDNNDDLRIKYEEYQELRINVDDSLDQWGKKSEKHYLNNTKNDESYLSCVNSQLGRLIDGGFITKQLLGISLLATDSDFDSISLRNIVSHIKKQQSFITREIFVCYDGAPYEYEEELRLYRYKEYKEATDKSKNGHSASWISGRIPANDSEDRHNLFDKMSGVKKRSRDDTISGEFFEWMERKLDNCQNVVEVAENVVFHQKRNPQKTGVTFIEIEECHIRLRKVFNTIALYFYNCSYAPTVSGYSLTENLDKPWIDRDRFSDIYEAERERSDKAGKDLSKSFGGIK